MYGIQRADEVIVIPAEILELVREKTGKPDATHLLGLGFFCRLCRVSFTELTPCEAPKPSEFKSMKERRAAERAFELASRIAIEDAPAGEAPQRIETLRGVFRKAGFGPME